MSGDGVRLGVFIGAELAPAEGGWVWLDGSVDAHNLAVVGEAAAARVGGEEYGVMDTDGPIGWAALATNLTFADLVSWAEYITGADNPAALLGYVLHVLSVDYARQLGPGQVGQLFEESFAGQHKDREAFGSELFDDCGYGVELSDSPLAPYLHLAVEGFTRDLFLGGDYYDVSDGEGGIYVFRSA